MTLKEYLETKEGIAVNLQLMEDQKSLLETLNSTLNENSKEHIENEATIKKLNEQIENHTEVLYKRGLAMKAITGFGDAFRVELEGMDYNLNSVMESMFTSYSEALVAFEDEGKARGMMIADATVQIMGQIVAQATAHIDAQIQVAREAYNIQK